MVYSREEKVSRLQQMIDGKRGVFLTIDHRKSHGYIYGFLQRAKDEMFKVSSDDVGLSYIIFPFDDVEAVGLNSIYLRF